MDMDVGERGVKYKRDKIVLIVMGHLSGGKKETEHTSSVNPPPKKRILDIFLCKLVQSFCDHCCHRFSNILMSPKYHNIKNKCNPLTKQ